jgi:hypothetical protein
MRTSGSYTAKSTSTRRRTSPNTASPRAPSCPSDRRRQFRRARRPDRQGRSPRLSALRGHYARPSPQVTASASSGMNRGDPTQVWSPAAELADAATIRPKRDRQRSCDSSSATSRRAESKRLPQHVGRSTAVMISGSEVSAGLAQVCPLIPVARKRNDDIFKGFRGCVHHRWTLRVDICSRIAEVGNHRASRCHRLDGSDSDSVERELVQNNIGVMQQCSRVAIGHSVRSHIPNHAALFQSTQSGVHPPRTS